jgi:sensor c-di-GMP phosphodiesterase-like protein
MQPTWGTRRSIKALIVLNALAVALPIAGLLAYSYLQTRDRVQQGLALIANASIARGDAVLSKVHRILSELSERGETTCSDAHRATYSQIVYNNIEIRGIGILDANNRLFECTDQTVLQPSMAVTNLEDLAVGAPGEIAIVSPREDIKKQVSIFINYGHSKGRIIDAAIYPEQFWDFQDALGLGEGGGVLLLDNAGRELTALRASNFKAPTTKEGRQIGFARYGDIYAVAQKSNKYPIEAVSIVSVDSVMAGWRKSVITFVPLVLLLAGVASFAIWRHAMRARPLAEALSEALHKDELHLVYQPILSLGENRIAAVEVLCRWTHPELGEISPDRFVAEAVRGGILPELSAWVFRRAATELKPLLAREAALQVSMNVGREDLVSNGLLGKAMMEHPDVLSRLIVEVTERDSLSEMMDEAKKTLSSWRDLGVKIALDDFGTGCCNLGYLRQLPIDIVKIDRMFASALDDHSNRADAEMFDAMHALLCSRRLTLVAEGVEREGQHAALLRRNIDLVQGWYYAKGMTLSALETWLAVDRSKDVAFAGNGAPH